MRTYIERAKYFIEQIFPYIDGHFTPWDVGEQVENFNKQFHRKVEVKSGLSRVAMITSDYVVKFDYDEEEIKNIGGCENEVALYAEAKKDGFAHLFAEITKYTYANRAFYIMPRIRGISEERWEYADHFMTDEESDWCDKHDLTDLHCNNYGFRKGRLCIVDYACRY